MTAKQKIEVERIKTGSELNTILDIALEDRSDDQKSAVVRFPKPCERSMPI